MPATLNSLPDELLLWVVAGLEDDDLVTLRTVSKRLSHTCMPQFASRFFVTRRHVMTPDSINALIKITEHAFLGKYVQRIALGTARLPSYYTPPIYDDPNIEIRPPQPEQHCPDKMYEVMAELSKVQVQYERNRNWLGPLTRVLSNLSTHPHGISIGIFDDCYTRGFGAKAFYEPVQLAINGREAYAEKRTFDVLWEAASQSKCPIKGVFADIDEDSTRAAI